MDANEDPVELWKRRVVRGSEGGGFATENWNATDDEATVGVVNVQIQIAIAGQARASVDERGQRVKQNLDLERAGGLRPEFVPVFVARNCEGRDQRARIDRGAV